MSEQESNTTQTGIAALAAREGEILLASEQSNEATYVPPAIENTGTDTAEQPAVAPPTLPEAGAEQPVEPPVPAPDVIAEERNDEATLQQGNGKIPGPDMTNANGTAVTNIMILRLEKHMKHLRGELGFADNKERFNEQVSWMETVGNSVKLPYEEFKLVTDALINAIANNKELFRSGAATRFNRGLAGTYPQSSINRYEAYIYFLVTVANNWATRHRLKSSIDVGTVIEHMPHAGQQNVTRYFNSLVSGK